VNKPERDALKRWIRWLAVLPGGLLAGTLALFPLHWVLYSRLQNFIDPVPELPERILSPFVIGACMIWFGARIAPTRKMETAVVLFGLWMVLLGGVIALVLFVGNVRGHGVYLQAGGVAPAMAFVGGVVGLLAVWRWTKREQTSQTGDSVTSDSEL
jgi:hypothetical protein